MSLKINVSKLTDLLDELRSGRAMPPEELEQVIQKVETVVAQIDLDILESPGPLAKGLREDVDKALGELDRVLKRQQPNQKMTQVFEKIIQVKAHLEEQPVPAPLIGKPKMGLKLAFYFTLDNADHNGVVLRDVFGSLDQEIPFITTSSLLSCREIQDGKGMATYLAARMLLEKAFLKNAPKWDIYQFVDEPYREEFIVCIPKSLFPEKSENERLEALDFQNKGKLKKVSFLEVLSASPRKADVMALSRLFNPKPTVDKIFYLAGHGGESSVGGLNANSYQRFLNFLDSQRCRGLTVFSCYSGGQSSLLNISEKRPHPFPIIVHSLGNFKSTGSSNARLHLYFEELQLFLEGKRPQTSKELQKVMDKMQKPKTYHISSQVCFPHSAQVPGGFRSVDEHGMGQTITYSQEVLHQLLSKGLITDKEHLNIYPLVIRTPIICKGSNPVLLSMVPGSSHHFIKSIKVESPDFSFLEKTLKFHENVSVKKAFFIGKIETEAGVIHEVVVFLSKDICECMYRQGNKYFKKAEASVSVLEHAQFFKEALESTVPDQKALRASSGGQESEATFQEALQAGFWTEPNPALPFLYTYSHENMQSRQELGLLIRTVMPNSSENEKKDFLRALTFFYIEKEVWDLALIMAQNPLLDPNAKNAMGIPLIVMAMRSENEPLVRHLLLSRRADIKVRETYENLRRTPVHEALEKNNLYLIQHVLSVADKEALNMPDFRGRTPLGYCLDRSDRFSFLRELGADIDHVDPESGRTLLIQAMSGGRLAQVTFLLKEGASPNVGSPSAMTQTCLRNLKGTLIKFMRAGGNPFKPDASAKIPFIQALLRGETDIALYLLKESQNDDLAVEQADGLNPALAALMSGDPAKIDAMRAKKAPFPERILNTPAEAIVKHLLLRPNTDKKMLLAWNAGRSKEFDQLVSAV